jgi:peptidoglycan/LPS O-acetylase OafA/YrhL
MHPKYRPDIDGLRSVAVFSVIGYHAFPGWIPGGFIGVDIFFVISGFLISTIIFGNLEQGTFSIADFYKRRIRRIFPALIAVMLAVLIFGRYLLVTDEYRQLGKHLIASALFVQNFTLWRESGYFDSSATSKPLLHLWSLAVEEQFYIFWPLLLAFLWKRRQSLAGTTIIVAMLSFAVNLVTIKLDSSAAYFLPFARFWELMIGGLLAHLYLHRPHLLAQYKEAQSALGAVLILLGPIVIRDEHSFPGWWALLPTLGAFFLISAGSSAWINKKILSNKWIVHAGLISYPLYLWHWPLLSFGFIVNPYLTHNAKLILIVVAIGLAELTHRYIELPLKAVAKKPRLPVYLLAGLGLFPLAGLLILLGYSTPRLSNLNMAMKNEWDFLKSQNVEFDENATGIYPFDLERGDITMYIGDSEVAQYAQRLSSAQEHNAASTGAIFVVGGGCIPIANVYNDDTQRRGCQKNLAMGLQRLQDPHVKRVVIGGSWNWYFFSEGYYYLDGDKRIGLETKEGRDRAFADLAAMMNKLKTQNKQVYLLLGNPINNDFDPHVHVPRLTAWRPMQMDPYVALDEKQAQLREQILRLADKVGVPVIDPSLSVCDVGKCRWITDDGLPIFKDTSHFNPDWAVLHADFIDRTIEPLPNTNAVIHEP